MQHEATCPTAAEADQRVSLWHYERHLLSPILPTLKWAHTIYPLYCPPPPPTPIRWWWAVVLMALFCPPCPLLPTLKNKVGKHHISSHEIHFPTTTIGTSRFFLSSSNFAILKTSLLIHVLTILFTRAFPCSECVSIFNTSPTA